jgi:CheY-like chemotaxis protein
MRLLLVEDDEIKGVQLTNFLNAKYPSVQLELARSLQSGIRRIRGGGIELVLLDMTLPNYDAGPDEPGGGTTHSFGGRELLKQMDRFDIGVPVIVVTQFEMFGKPPDTMDLPELDTQLRLNHAAIYRGAVYYHASIHGWKEKLKGLIDDALCRPNSEGEIDA